MWTVELLSFVLFLELFLLNRPSSSRSRARLSIDPQLKYRLRSPWVLRLCTRKDDSNVSHYDTIGGGNGEAGQKGDWKAKEL